MKLIFTEITCSQPPSVHAASIVVEGNATTIGSTVTYQCIEGFVLYRDEVKQNHSSCFNKTCQVDHDTLTGKWTGNYSCKGRYFVWHNIKS